jgi:hypothetical protein
MAHYDSQSLRVRTVVPEGAGALDFAAKARVQGDSFSLRRNLAMTRPKKRRLVFFNLAKIQMPVGALTSADTLDEVEFMDQWSTLALI